VDQNKESQSERVITADMNIQSLLKKHPETLRVLLRHGIHCAGCYISGFHDIATVCDEHDIPVDVLLTELNAAVAPPTEA